MPLNAPASEFTHSGINFEVLLVFTENMNTAVLPPNASWVIDCGGCPVDITAQSWDATNVLIMDGVCLGAPCDPIQLTYVRSNLNLQIADGTPCATTGPFDIDGVIP